MSDDSTPRPSRGKPSGPGSLRWPMDPGYHEITMETIVNPWAFGSAYLRLTEVIPEPASEVVWGLLAGLGLLVLRRKGK